MFYQFKCNVCNHTFEIQQPITAEHNAKCPECGADCQRMFSTFQWIWAGTLYREDGSRREDKDYAALKG